MDLVKLREQLASEEDVRFFPYIDTKGNATIGIGHNLTGRGISQQVLELIYQEDVDEAIDDLNRELSWWKNLDDVRARVFADLCFNMGINALLEFHNMISASVSSDWGKAAKELMDSQWYIDVGPIRGTKLVNMLLTGLDQ
jgi:lysozyme